MVKGCWLDFGGWLVYGSRKNICKTLWITILFLSDIPTRAPEYQYSHEGPLHEGIRIIKLPKSKEGWFE